MESILKATGVSISAARVLRAEGFVDRFTLTNYDRDVMIPAVSYVSGREILESWGYSVPAALNLMQRAITARWIVDS